MNNIDITQIKDLNNESSFAYKFLVEIEGLDSRVVKSCSLPTHVFNNSINQFTREPPKEITITAYMNAAPFILKWIDESTKTKDVKVTVYKNNDDVFIEHFYGQCFLSEANVGSFEYSDQNPATVSFTMIVGGKYEWQAHQQM